MVKAIVLRAAGTNCDYETGVALKLSGFEVANLHVNELVAKKELLKNTSLLVLPGGFSYGDYLGSAKVFANQLKLRLREPLTEFIDNKKMVLGICNGFQALVKSGLLPATEGQWKQNTTLTFNESGHFQDEWVTMQKVPENKSPFVKGIKEFDCPINHGEGRFIARDKKTLKDLYDQGLVALTYKVNPNGSTDSIAGISNKSGLVFGLMPHPEKHAFSANHPHSTRKDFPEKGTGLKIFENAFEYLKK